MTNKPFRLKITQEHIDNQENPGNGCQCAIHDALFEKFGQDFDCQYACIKEGKDPGCGHPPVFYCSPGVRAWQKANNNACGSRAKPTVLRFDPEAKTVTLLKEWENR